MKSRLAFWIGLASGTLGLLMLAHDPANTIAIIPFWISLVLTDPTPTTSPRWMESTKDASGLALVLAFSLLAAIFIACLLPASVWSSFGWSAPDWMYGSWIPAINLSPRWGTVVLVVVWLIVMWRRARQLKRSPTRTAT